MARVTTHEDDLTGDEITNEKDVNIITVQGAITNNARKEIILSGDSLETLMDESDSLKSLILSDDD